MGFRLEHRIGVGASPAILWDLVRDLERWPEWTEIYTEAGGKLAIGEKLHFTFKLGDRAPMSYVGTVYDWVPEAQMAWSASLYGGTVRSLRYVEIEKLSETSCILANGDYWTGPLAGLMPKATRRLAQDGFRRMNEHAKRIAEERFAAAGGRVQPARDDLANEIDAPMTIQPLMQPSMTGPAKFFGRGGGLMLGPKLKRS